MKQDKLRCLNNFITNGKYQDQKLEKLCKGNGCTPEELQNNQLLAHGATILVCLKSKKWIEIASCASGKELSS